MPISDSEMVWKADQEELKKQFPLQLDEQDEREEIQIIVNTVDDESLRPDAIALQHDYIALPESSDEDSSSSSSEKSDYSW